jgi:hypothetical protein
MPLHGVPRNVRIHVSVEPCCCSRVDDTVFGAIGLHEGTAAVMDSAEMYHDSHLEIEDE